MHIQRVINFKSEYRNTKQIQISNAQIIEEPRSMRSTAERQNLRGMRSLFRFKHSAWTCISKVLF